MKPKNNPSKNIFKLLMYKYNYHDQLLSRRVYQNQKCIELFYDEINLCEYTKRHSMNNMKHFNYLPGDTKGGGWHTGGGWWDSSNGCWA